MTAMPGPMPTCIAAVLTALAAQQAAACACFTPEMRERAGRDTLETAQAVVYGRISAIRADGSGELVVQESFKGPPRGAIVPIVPGSGACPAQADVQGQEVLVVAYQLPVTVCEKYPSDHFLLPVLRALPAR